MTGNDGDLRQQKANALALIRQQRLAEASGVCRQICDAEPAIAENWFMLATVAGQLGQLDEALDGYNQALHLNPEFTPAYINLGNLLFARGKVQEAESCYRQVVALQADSVDALANLGKVLQSQGRFSEAERYFRKALTIQPELPDLYNELGMSLNGQGRPVEAADVFRRAIALQADFHTASSNLLLTLNYSADFTPEQVFTEHHRWGKAVEACSTPDTDHPNSRDPERRLRVAYISPDFRDHSVACFFAPLLENHDAGVLETFCYSDVLQPDAVTQRLTGEADNWRSLVGMSDEQVADLVRADRIDILVDLAGHTARNRLPVFASRPAPVQVTWLGYPNTTGLSAMDYRLVDAWTDPEGAADGFYAESLVRLPDGFLCYQPLTTSLELTACPSLETGHVTFGSFNSFVKMTPAVFRTWAELLHAVPGSRLLLKNFSLNDPDIRAQCKDAFQSLGIGRERLELHAILPSKQAHLALYRHIDIALDTFPYNGTTTTCEALWMGIPVVTLAGDQHAGRVGLSLMNALGLPQLIAADHDEYCTLAVELAADIDQRQQWRTSLRTKMEASSLCNGAEFAHKVEGVYREMWIRWCMD